MGFKGGVTAITGNDGTLGYTTCVANTISNAMNGSPMDNTKVYTCMKGFSVAYNELSCTAFTTDEACRKLGSTNAYCGQCWYSYYFSTTTCTLGANLLALCGIVMAAFY